MTQKARDILRETLGAQRFNALSAEERRKILEETNDLIKREGAAEVRSRLKKIQARPENKAATPEGYQQVPAGFASIAPILGALYMMGAGDKTAGKTGDMEKGVDPGLDDASEMQAGAGDDSLSGNPFEISTELSPPKPDWVA